MGHRRLRAPTMAQAVAVEGAKVSGVRRGLGCDEFSLAIKDGDRTVEPEMDFDHLAGICEPSRRSR